MKKILSLLLALTVLLSTVSVVMANTAPTVEVTAAGDITTMKLGESVVITATGADADDGDTATLTYTFYVNDVVAGGTTTTNTFTFTPHRGADTVYTIKAVCTDTTGDTAEDSVAITVSGPAVTITKIESSLTEDGLAGNDFDEYNTKTVGYNDYNYYIAGDNSTKGRMDNYAKFDISGLSADDNITNVSYLTWVNANSQGKTIYAYSFDTTNYTSDGIAPELSANAINSFVVPNPRVFFYDEFRSKVSNSDYYCVEIDITDYVKTAVAEGKTEIGIAAVKPDSAYGSIAKKPMISVKTSSNKSPSVELSSEKSTIEVSESIDITAMATDADGDAVTYKFYINNAEVTDESLINDNVLTFSANVSGDYTIKVECADEWGGISSDTVVVKVEGPTITIKKLESVLTKDGLAGKDFDEYNSITQMNAQYGNIYISGPNSGKGRVDNYAKFDISGLANDNITKVSYLTWVNSNSKGATFYAYSFDTSAYTADGIAPELSENAINSFDAPNPLVAFTDEFRSKVNNGSDYNIEIDITDYVKTAVAEGKTEIGIAAVKPNDSYGTIAKISMISVKTTTNNIPTVSLQSSTDTLTGVNFDEPFTVTATGNDADGDAISYKFYIDGTEAEASAVNENILTPSGLSNGTHIIKVECKDRWGDIGVDTLEISGYSENFGTDVITVNVGSSDIATSKKTAGSIVTKMGEYNEHNLHQRSEYYNYVKYPVSAINEYEVDKVYIAMTYYSSNDGTLTDAVYPVKEDWSIGSEMPEVDTDNLVGTTTYEGTAKDNKADLPSGVAIDDADYNHYIDITDYVKGLAESDEQYINLAMTLTQGSYQSIGYAKKPVLRVVRQLNKRPVITVKSPGVAIASGETAKFSVEVTDFEGRLDYVELWADNEKLTNVTSEGDIYSADINFETGAHILKAVAVDKTGCKRTVTKTIKVDRCGVEINVIDGDIAAGETITAAYSVQNYSSLNKLNFYVIISVYKPDGSLYDVQYEPYTLDESGSNVFSCDYTFGAGDFTGYTAETMIWDQGQLSPLGDVGNF